MLEGGGGGGGGWRPTIGGGFHSNYPRDVGTFCGFRALSDKVSNKTLDHPHKRTIQTCLQNTTFIRTIFEFETC